MHSLCRAKIAPSTVEVRFKDLTVEAMIYLGNRSVPSVLNSYRNALEVTLVTPRPSRQILLSSICFCLLKAW
jgi:hypothetical protein